MDRLGRYANDAPQHESNAVMRQLTFCGELHLCLFAKNDIAAHEEILYDYGDKKNKMEWRQYVH